MKALYQQERRNRSETQWFSSTETHFYMKNHVTKCVGVFRRSLYWTVSQKSNVRDQVQCFCCQHCYINMINHYNTPPSRRMLTHDTVKKTAVQRYYVNSVCPGSSTTNIPHAQHANKDRNVLKYYICTRTEATLWMQCLQINQLIVA